MVSATAQATYFQLPLYNWDRETRIHKSWKILTLQTKLFEVLQNGMTNPFFRL
jgi:hypothetical protein